MRKLAYFASEGTVSSGEDEATASDLFTIIFSKILTTLLIAAFYTLFLLMIDRNLFSRGQQYIRMQLELQCTQISRIQNTSSPKFSARRHDCTAHDRA